MELLTRAVGVAFFGEWAQGQSGLAGLPEPSLDSPTMRIFYSDPFTLTLPEGHRFPMEKYALLREAVEASLPQGSDYLTVPDPATDQELETVHTADYVRRVTQGTLSPAEVRRIGFPWSPDLVERSRRAVGGTIAAARTAPKDGLSVNLSGGTHHAFPDRGEGFCVFNDVAVAARVLQREGLARRIGIVDLDVHQGNGTALIFRDDPDVFTLSVHGGNNYPFRKEPSDLDLDLPDGAGDEAYLEATRIGVERVLQHGGLDLVFYLAGSDPHEGDRLGKLSVTKEGLKERDRIVLEGCREAHTPVAIVMSGGYGVEISNTVEIHLNTVLRAQAMFTGFPRSA